VDVEAITEKQPVILNEPISEAGNSFFEDFDFRNPLTMAFIAALIFGIASEVVMGSYGPLLAGLGMLAYFLYGGRLPPTARNTERFADSLYYLGFILTLFALLLAMTPSLNGGHAPRSDDIIQKFGAAIVTTFVGMTLRIILIQLKPNVSDHEEDTRESIAKYVKELNYEVTATVAEMARFRSSVITTMDSTLAEFETRLASNTENAGGALNEASAELFRRVKDAVMTVEAAVNEVAVKLSNLDVPTDYLSGRITRAGDALTADIGSLSTRIHDASSVLTDALGGNATSLQQIKMDTDALQKLLSKVSVAVTKTAEIADRSLTSASLRLDQAEQTATGMKVLGQTAGELAAHLQALSSSLERRYREEEDTANKLIGEMRTSAADIRDSKSDFQSAIAESSLIIRTAIDEVARDE
jgi:hypothetical protein